ncbi:MAG TPA: HAMP domain-containing sensor histidine kinase, partial [Polyangia bacterium]|nr:HAMP domain-containing sensor histidine kinase [Polyangia bacterium]
VSVFDPARSIRDAVRLFAVAKQKQCRVDLSVAALPAVRGSSARLGQVIINLLQNGLDAAGDGCTLVVRSDSPGDDVRILVTDGGPGIPAHVAERIFEPFFSSKGSNGMGLGLSICREIVEELAGTIDFETGPQGTTFRVMLPGFHPDVSGPTPV